MSFEGMFLPSLTFAWLGTARQVPMIDYRGISGSLTLNHNLFAHNDSWDLPFAICRDGGGEKDFTYINQPIKNRLKQNTKA